MKRWSYWAELAFRFFIYICLGSMVYGFMMNLSSDSFTVQNWMAMSFSYGILMFLFIITSTNTGNFFSVANLTLSMGETRKNALIGINIYNLTALCCIVVISLILSLLSGGKIISLIRVFVTMPCLYILASGFGLCCSTMKEGTSFVLTGLQLVFMLIGAVMVFAAAYFTGMVKGFSENSFSGNSDTFHALPVTITAVAGILFYVIGNIRMRDKLSTLEVNL